MNNTDTLKNAVYNVFDSLETNNFATLGKPNEPMWEAPLIGVAAGDDEYFQLLKGHIGEFYWTPKEAFALKYGNAPEAKNLRVISLIFPQTEATKAMQAKDATVFPCDNWVVSRGEWEPLMKKFCSRLENALEEIGIRAAAIDLISGLSVHKTEKLGFASNWSHRHGAFAAGLGTFGLSDGFISEKGKAIRITTIIVEADVDITARGDRGIYDWCLHYNGGKCGACIDRCPINAISESGHDKQKCGDYEDEAEAKYWPKHIERGDYIFGCGICQCKVPCMSKRP